MATRKKQHATIAADSPDAWKAIKKAQTFRLSTEEGTYYVDRGGWARKLKEDGKPDMTSPQVNAKTLLHPDPNPQPKAKPAKK